MAEDAYLAAIEEKIEAVVDKCWNCNFCFSVCPNYLSSRGFQTQGPSGMTQSLRYALRWNRFDAEAKKDLRRIVYACTTCNACVNACKDMSSGVLLLDAIMAGRELLVEKQIGPLPRQGKCLEEIFRAGNPYGKPPKKRLAWCRELGVPFLSEAETEVLLYVGCAAAYDPDLRDAVTSLIRILQTFGVDFGMLEDESCCGDPARFLGDAALFQEVVAQNGEKIKKSGVRTIITVSPHCYHAFAHHYPDLPRTVDVVHYSEFLYRLFSTQPPEWPGEQDFCVTYHDPCYLGKHNGIYDPPRKLIDAIPGVRRVEMSLSGPDSLCCGGGGGRMFDEIEEERRLSDMRVEQALETGARVLVTACPWCLTMLGNAARDTGADRRLEVRDIAQVLWAALQPSTPHDP